MPTDQPNSKNSGGGDEGHGSDEKKALCPSIPSRPMIMAGRLLVEVIQSRGHERQPVLHQLHLTIDQTAIRLGPIEALFGQVESSHEVGDVVLQA